MPAVYSWEMSRASRSGSPGSGVTSADEQPAAFGPSLDFFALPSLADERATYDLLGWARTSGDEAFDFVDPGAITTTNTHDDSEADDLWTWDAQVRRGYSASIAATMRSRWLAYFKGGAYRADVQADDGNRGDITAITSADPLCHLYGPGLVMVGYLDADAAAITEAEALADIGLTQHFGGTTAPGSGGKTLVNGADLFGHGGGRNMARIAQLVANLAYATGKAKWVAWLTALIDAYLTAPTYSEVTVAGQVRGAYFCDLDWLDNNGQCFGYAEGSSTRTDYGTFSPEAPDPSAAYAAGVRSNSSYQYGMHAEFLWRAWLITRRADLRTRLIAFARFMEYFAHDPGHTTAGGPFGGSYFGRRGTERWHRDLPGGGSYDASVINILVWGYKLTGDSALLTKARTVLRQATRWLEGEPAGSGRGPEVPADEVFDFIDTRRNVAGSKFFIDNKGQLQYCYQIFENGGDPPTLGDPAWLGSQAVNAWAAISGTTIGGGIPSVNPYSLDTIGLVGRWNGYAFDDVNLRFYGLANGGHNDYAGNQVLRCDLGSSPGWTEPVPSTTVAAGSIAVNGSNTAQETYGDGKPSSAHSYYCHQFVRKAGRAFLFGQGAIWNSGGVTNNVFAYAEGASDYDHSGSNYQQWADLSGSQFESVRTVCKHPTTEDVYYNASGTLYRWRVAAPFTAGSETHTSLGSTPTSFNYYCSAIDSYRNRIIFWRGCETGGAFGGVASTTVHIYTIDTAAWTTDTLTGAAAATITGGSAGVYQATDYCPATDKFYVMLRGTSGGTVYEINASTFAVAAVSATGGGSIPADTNGPCNRMRYALLPSGKGGLFFHPTHTSNVWFLRLH